MQLENAPYEILFMPLPIVTDSIPEQDEKACNPIDVTLLGMVTDVRPLQPPYLQLAVYQCILIKTVEK